MPGARRATRTRRSASRERRYTPPPMSQNLVASARGLRKKFADLTALDGIDLEVPEGIVFGLLGPNGAGKTTITRILATLEHASAGEATVLGFDVSRDAGRVCAR